VYKTNQYDITIHTSKYSIRQTQLGLYATYTQLHYNITRACYSI